MVYDLVQVSRQRGSSLLEKQTKESMKARETIKARDSRTASSRIISRKKEHRLTLLHKRGVSLELPLRAGHPRSSRVRPSDRSTSDQLTRHLTTSSWKLLKRPPPTCFPYRNGKKYQKVKKKSSFKMLLCNKI